MISPLLKTPYTLDKLGTALTTEARGQVSQILPLEAGKTFGQSFMGLKRSGFLEFQERLFEELTVAFVWLYGVGLVNKQLDKVLAKRQQQGKSVVRFAQTDWSFDWLRRFLPQKFWGQKPVSVGLSPLERMTYNHTHLLQTLKTKGLKWALAVGVPLSLCGYFIPKLNQWKTQWILDTFYRPHPDKQGASLGEMRQILNTPQSQAFSGPTFVPPNQGASWTPYTNAWPMSQAYPPMPTVAWPMPAWPMAPTRFGFGPSTVRSLAGLGGLGSLVDNTTYGQILVMDAGITGGRMVVASKRSPYESLEYLARDVGSLVFYLKTVPWIISGTGALLEKGLRVHNVIEMDAQAMSVVNRTLMQALQQSGQGYLVEPLKRQLAALSQGQEAKLKQMESVLISPLNRAESGALKRTVESYVRTSHGADVAKTLFQHQGFSKPFVSGGDLATILEAVQGQTGAFGHWDEATRFSVSKSLRLGFELESGLTSSGLQAATKAWTAQDPALAKQLHQAAQAGGNRLMATLLRESQNLHLQLSPYHNASLASSEALVRIAERATLEGGPLKSFAHDHLTWILDEYAHFIQSSGGKHPIQSQAAKALSQQAQHLRSALAQGKPISAETLKSFAQGLVQNGRKGPSWLWFTQGTSLKHLAEDVETLMPAFEGKHPSGDLSHWIDAQLKTWIQHAQKQCAPRVVEQLQLTHQKLKALLQGEGRVQLIANPKSPDFAETVSRELGHMLRGNVAHNRGLMNRVTLALGRRPKALENFFEEAEVNDLRQQVRRYGELLMQKINAQSGPLTLGKVQQAMAHLRKTHMTQRYTTYGVALAASIWGAGIWLPKAIYWMTRHMTGQNQHPGIATLNGYAND